MSFPKTRHTLIQRIASAGEEDDWRQFMSDYWRPVCRFAVRWGNLSIDDAEDVASATFDAVMTNNLLRRWLSNQSAKLRTLLCSVVRHVLANRQRVEAGRARLLRENRDAFKELASVQLDAHFKVELEPADAFYSAWAEELLQDAVESLLGEYLKAGKGDYFRVLYGRICEGITMPQIAASLGLKQGTAENFYKRARKRLGENLQQRLREHVRRYCPGDEADAEFRSEWDCLGNFLQGRGGIEKALRQSYESFDSTAVRQHEQSSMTTILTQAPKLASPPETTPS